MYTFQISLKNSFHCHRSVLILNNLKVLLQICAYSNRETTYFILTNSTMCVHEKKLNFGVQFAPAEMIPVGLVKALTLALNINTSFPNTCLSFWKGSENLAMEFALQSGNAALSTDLGKPLPRVGGAEEQQGHAGFAGRTGPARPLAPGWPARVEATISPQMLTTSGWEPRRLPGRWH